MTERLLITGSREWDDRAKMELALSEHFSIDTVMVNGAARGADSMAAEIWEAWGGAVERHPADWLAWGKAAGFIRNQHMVASGADICVAFFKEAASNRGTSDCAGRATKAGIPVIEVWG